MTRESRPTGVLVMAYGSASGPHDVERYYTDIRGGRPPSPAHLAALLDRYAAIGNRFPLFEITKQQADGLEHALNERQHGAFAAYIGMKHSPPFVANAVETMRDDGIGRAVGIVMAPHWSGMSVQTYIDRVQAASSIEGPAFTFVKSYHDHPMFVDLLANRVRDALGRISEPNQEKAAVIFSAHSLPTRTSEDGSLRCKVCDCAGSCRYREGLQETADLVAAREGIGAYTIGWQSAGRTNDRWWGPPIEEGIRALAGEGHPAVVVCSAGFVADHLEILYDLDIEAKGVAEEAGVEFARTEMPNADPAFTRMLAAVVQEHLEGSPAS
jgi:protoporphyrin/coproporphyrin ferrochelatase